MASGAQTWVSEKELGLKPCHITLFNSAYDSGNRVMKELEQIVCALDQEKYRKDDVIQSVSNFLENALEDIKEAMRLVDDRRYRVQIGNEIQNRVRNVILFLLQGSMPLLVRVSPALAAVWPSEDDNITLEQLDLHEKPLKSYSKTPSYGVLGLIFRQLRQLIEVRNRLSSLHEAILDKVFTHIYSVSRSEVAIPAIICLAQGRELEMLISSFLRMVHDIKLTATFRASMRQYTVKLTKLQKRLKREMLRSDDVTDQCRLKVFVDFALISKDFRDLMMLEAVRHCPENGFSMTVADNQQARRSMPVCSPRLESGPRVVEGRPPSSNCGDSFSPSQLRKRTSDAVSTVVTAQANSLVAASPTLSTDAPVDNFEVAATEEDDPAEITSPDDEPFITDGLSQNEGDSVQILEESPCAPSKIAESKASFFSCCIS